ncbi:MAG: hypothetical protein P8181_13615, partial [bacterium]
EIAYYEYAVTNNDAGTFDPADTTRAANWHRVYRNDSTFAFSADVPADSSDIDPDDLKPVEFRRSHTFFIRAVDQKGLASRKPAYRSFTSKTLSPVVDILVPPYDGFNPVPVSTISTFQWMGEDYVTTLDETQEPDSVRWILVPTEQFNDDWSATLEYIRANPGAPEWSDWSGYATHNKWTTPPLEYGPYLFAVQVMDEADAVSPVYDEARNVRRVLVTESSPPAITVYSQFVGAMGAAGLDAPTAIIDFPTGTPVSFRFKAGSTSGSAISGYRYGWDILDLTDDTQWDIPFTPFASDDNSAESVPRSFTEGLDSHTFHVEVIDNSGFKARLGIRINLVPMTMNKSVRVVDDWVEPYPGGFTITNGATPSDDEHDAFWAFVLDGVGGFDPLIDMIDVAGVTEMPLNVLADYKCVIWSAPGYLGTGDPPLLWRTIQFLDPNHPGSTLEPRVNTLAMYMAAGGHVMLCGENIMLNAAGTFIPGIPLITRYELSCDQDGDYEESIVGRRGIGELSFAYGPGCLDVLDMAYTPGSYPRRRLPTASCPVFGVRVDDRRSQGLRTALPFPGGFPGLDLRPEVSSSGMAYAEERSGLNTDIYNPAYFGDLCSRIPELAVPRDCFEPIYGHGCLDASSVIYDAPVAYWTSTYADRVPDVAGGVVARSTIWGFHPVYFNPDEVKSAMELILIDEWRLPTAPASPNKTPD